MELITQKNKVVYSDGSVTEARMLEIAQTYHGEELDMFMKNNFEYTTNNTFSKVRENLLSWYPFTKEDTVLEIGAGMGSLTGLLCDRCKHVTSVEMGENRAKVIEARYKGRENLTLYVGDINEFEINEKFDYVVFVGVLEYAAVFSDSEKPFHQFLNSANKFLKQDGKMLFAIENQYGLKYWLGASEDHLQKPFVGIEGYKTPKTPRTFSKAKLEKLVEEVGLKYHRVYGVVPDYKFPTLMFSEEWKPSGSDLQNIAYTYAKGSTLIANEKHLYHDLAENDVIQFFANSFFVEASAESLDSEHAILITGRSEVKPEYRITTKIISNNTIEKIAGTDKAKKHLSNTENNEERLQKRGINVLKSRLEDGKLVRQLSDLKRADTVFCGYLENGDHKNALKMLEKLRDELLKSSDMGDIENTILHKKGIVTGREAFGHVLKDGYIDMTFYNAFLDNEELVFFDQEWCFPDVPLQFILYYAVKCMYQRCGIEAKINLSVMLDHMGILDKHRVLYDKLESIIWEEILARTGDLYGEGGYCTQYHNTLTLNEFIARKDAAYTKLAEEKDAAYNRLAEEKDAAYNRLAKEKDAAYNRLAEEKDAAYNRLAKEKDTIYKEFQLEKQELEQIIINKEGHISLLLESDRELERIKSSRSWRFMGYAWRLRDIVVPKGSKRRLLGKITIKFIKHPIRFLSKCTPTRIGKFFYTLKREGVEGTSRKMDDCLVGTDIPKTEIEIVSVSQDEIKKISDYSMISVQQWDMPQVSIIIPVYNQFDYTYHCIQSIVKNSGDITYEIIIADDCSTDITKEIEKAICGIQVIRNSQNLRFLRNCNNAANYAKGEYILFLNNDTQVQENWLAPLVELIERDKTIGMVGSKLVYPDGRLQEAGGILWKDGSAWNYGNRSDPDLPEFNYVKDVDYISGAAIMISKSLWNEIGGFDERFVPAYCEDSDLAFEVRKHGYRTVYQPLSVVVHFEGVSNGTDTSSGQKAYQVVNSQKFYEKWKDILQNEHFENAQNVFQARDRSRNKQTVLVIDHYVPMYDKDAGSRTIYQYLELLTSMDYNVKFIGDNFYPHQPYTSKLEQMGVEVLYGLYYQKHWKQWLKENGNLIDVVFINRPHIAEKYIDEVKQLTHAKIIYNVCDLHFVREKRQYELTKEKELLQSSEKWKKIELSLIEKADTVFTLSSDEKRIIDEHCQEEKASICPIFIYSDFSKTSFERMQTKDLLFVGGFNHNPNVDAVIWFCEKVFPLVLEKLPDVKFNIVGSNPPDTVRKYASENIIIKGFVSDEELKTLYEQCKLCVIPLRYGAGVKGKTIEAMYSTIPIVSTSVGIEGLTGINEIIVPHDNEHEFAKAVLDEYTKDNTSQVKAAYEYVKAHYSEDSAKQYFAEQFRKG